MFGSCAWNKEAMLFKGISVKFTREGWNADDFWGQLIFYSGAWSYQFK